MGPPYLAGGPWGPLLLPSRGPRAPYFTQKGPMGPLTIVFPPGKKFSPALPANNFFRFTVEFGGPWGPLPLPSRGPRAPYFYPEGAHGAPYGWFSYEEKIQARLRA